MLFNTGATSVLNIAVTNQTEPMLLNVCASIATLLRLRGEHSYAEAIDVVIERVQSIDDKYISAIAKLKDRESS